MPGYKTHLLGGLAAFFATSLVLAKALSMSSPTLFLGYFLCALIGSIFPDIDIASKMQRLFFIAATGALSFALLTNRTSCFLIISGSVLLVTLLRHRTLTHQVYFLICMPFFFALGSVYLYKLPFNPVINSTIFFVMGCLSHVFLDRSQTRLKKILKGRYR